MKTDRDLLIDLYEIVLTNTKADWTAHNPVEEFKFLTEKIKSHLLLKETDYFDEDEGDGY